MEAKSNIDDCEKLVKQIQEEERKLNDVYRMKDYYERNLRDMKKKLYQKCEHNWVRDWEDVDERSRWICSKCKLSRHAYY
tara:strand:+ start:494 stop:733 length:240 start_codon:yes stop_codon:yes gene_type:complete